ncbi:hypothetical protein [Salibacter halophilus]|uniref:Lipoprotein n=1 Tax=Salibacter halophilus TaxID=1803916 RepID=A0A6N6M3N6_9FLAO|nr:hypothetical protein [Salibacter halophilus]KAB1062050.1 hypothetical protein F3059_13315 [Salibacter halophilus]
MNSKTYLSLPSLVLLFASCALLKPEEKRQCYRTLKDFAKEHWKFSNHDSVLAGTMRNEMVSKFVEKDGNIPNCCYKMSFPDIKRIFGTPHQIVYDGHKVKKFYYFTTLSCYPSLEESRYCEYFYFHFNDEGVCTDIGASGKQTSH